MRGKGCGEKVSTFHRLKGWGKDYRGKFAVRGASLSVRGRKVRENPFPWGVRRFQQV